MRVRQGKIGDPFLIDDRNGLDMGAKQVLDYIFGDGNFYVVGQKPCLFLHDNIFRYFFKRHKNTNKLKRRKSYAKRGC